MDKGNSESVKYVIYGIVGIAVIGVVYFGVIKPITDTLGLTRDKDEREADKIKDKLSRTQVLSPNLYKENRDKVTITSGRASSLAYDIWSGRSDALGSSICCDDEDKAIGGITSAGSKVNISYISDIFQRQYGFDLLSYLDNDYLEDEHWKQIDDYIDKIQKF